MNPELQFLSDYPNAIFLSQENKDGIERLLKKHQIITESDGLASLKKAGDGNMNCVMRATTNSGSFILKQSRPWVEKYPQIAAPIERINIESAFIKQSLSILTLKKHTPQIIAHLPDHFLLIMEDLGEASDFSNLYFGGKISISILDILCDYLNSLHTLKVNTFPDNKAMRTLNHEHIFHLPFVVDNGLQLDEVQEGLGSIAYELKSNKKLIGKIEKLGKIYLSDDHTTLIHGDFYPASFLDTASGLKVIDAEFSFIGPSEFDWAVLLAHLVMSSQAETTINHFISKFKAKKELDQSLIYGFAGVEILRRLLGVAQLPLDVTISEKKEWMDQAVEWIRSCY